MNALHQSNSTAWPTPHFWWLQIGGWLLYPVFIHLAYTPTEQFNNWLLLPSYYAWETFLGFTLTLMLRELWKRLWETSIWIAVLVNLLAVAISAEIWTVGKLVLYYQYFDYIQEQDFWKTTGEWYPNSLTVFAAWSAIYYGFKYRNTLIERESSLLAAQAAAKDAQLRMLRYQLNPHFLFNTLANICALISDGNATRAKNMTVELSEFLRYSLDNDPSQTTSVKDEIEIIKLYFNIEKIRYANRLNYDISIDPNTEDCQIPSMLLQPLVENAIKHAIAPSLDGGIISIHSSVLKNCLILSVKDNGQGIQEKAVSDKRQGIGLTNTRERLSSFYGTKQKLELLDVEPHGLEVRITIPMTSTPGKNHDS
ncbi:Sensor histidine kinase YpdA [Thalassocella blandensis]|nr:Sensor histidine kinase YpdA [Thalassocella blandensis]